VEDDAAAVEDEAAAAAAADGRGAAALCDGGPRLRPFAPALPQSLWSLGEARSQPHLTPSWGPDIAGG
jgi:hypothetical protein